MKKRKTEKRKTYICLACGAKKTTNKVKCCGKDMVSQSRGSWNM